MKGALHFVIYSSIEIALHRTLRASVQQSNRTLGGFGTVDHLCFPEIWPCWSGASSKSVGNDAWLQQLGRTVWLVFHAGSSTMKSCRFSNKTDYHDQAKNIFQLLVHVSPLFFFVSGIWCRRTWWLSMMLTWAAAAVGPCVPKKHSQLAVCLLLSIL